MFVTYVKKRWRVMTTYRNICAVIFKQSLRHHIPLFLLLLPHRRRGKRGDGNMKANVAEVEAMLAMATAQRVKRRATEEGAIGTRSATEPLHRPVLTDLGKAARAGRAALLALRDLRKAERTGREALMWAEGKERGRGGSA